MSIHSIRSLYTLMSTSRNIMSVPLTKLDLSTVYIETFKNHQPVLIRKEPYSYETRTNLTEFIK